MNTEINKTKAAFYWIIDVLKRLKIPFQISGGLAALAYGANRPLADIDIDIPEESFDIIKTEVKPYIIYGPDLHKSDVWELMLMQLDYHHQIIELCGAYQTKIYDKTTHRWVAIPANFSNAQTKNIFGMDVPVIAKKELIFYKKILAREVDLIDLKQMDSC